MSPLRRGAEADDWVSREAWRDWGDPDADVALTPTAPRLLATMLPPRSGEVRVPVPAALVPQGDGTVSVEVGGYAVGRLAAGAAADVARDLGGRVAVPGLILRAGDPEAAPRVRLWAGRRLSEGMSVTTEVQREEHASRVVGPATRRGRGPATG